MRRISGYIIQGAVLLLLVALVTLVSRLFLISEAATTNPSATATIPSLASAPSSTPVPPTATPSPSVTPSLTATPTPTFTSTPTPAGMPPPPVVSRRTPVFDPLPTPSGTPYSLPQPTPLPLLEQPEGVVNIVLLGTDAGGALTDVMMVASVNPEGPYVSLLSIPRDFYAWIPTYGFGKINTANSRGRDYPGGGPALVKATIEYNLGIPIDYYALVHFEGFISIVDALGGINVPVECELHDTFPDPADPQQGIDIDLYPGMQHLDGQYALWYVRSRKGVSTRDVYGVSTTSDFDRNRRQQQVLRAIYARIRSTDVLGQVPELWGAFQETVETDLDLRGVSWLAWVGSQLDLSNVKSRFIGPPYVTSWTEPGGGAVQVPVPDAIPVLVAEAMQPPAVGRAAQPAFRVEVHDGTGRPGMAEVAVARLRWEGFNVVGVQVIDPIPRTQIVDLTTTDKGSPLWLLTRLYAREPQDVISEPTEGSPIDFRVLLGADYNSCVSTTSIHYVPAPTPTPTPIPTPGP
ncbi:MAG: LCP family protein [Anaerolineae bacterium]